jgi:hypothetical protein
MSAMTFHPKFLVYSMCLQKYAFCKHFSLFKKRKIGNLVADGRDEITK